jgi:hypothetical protein
MSTSEVLLPHTHDKDAKPYTGSNHGRVDEQHRRPRVIQNIHIFGVQNYVAASVTTLDAPGCDSRRCIHKHRRLLRNLGGNSD